VARSRDTRSPAIAETAGVTIRSETAVEQLTIIINMTYVYSISQIELSIREILYPVSCVS